MEFLYPAFLFGLAAVLIPIIIHLFHFRRFKRVYFTNVRFLKEVKEETTSRSRLKHLLVLISRILAIVFLVMAFAQPYLPGKEQSAETEIYAVSVFVDNSYSMATEGESEILFEKARRMASNIAKAYGKETRFQLLTHDLEGKHQRLLSQEQFLSFLDELLISPASRSFEDIQGQIRLAMKNDEGLAASIYLISDFQSSHGLPVSDSLHKLNLLPLKGVNAENLYIDSVWFAEPIQLVNQSNALVVRIVNDGVRSFENQAINLELNGQSKPGSFSLAPKLSTLDTLFFTATKSGWNEALIQIDDYPITFDDAYYLAFEVVDQISVSVINEENPSPFLSSIYADPKVFQLTNQRLAQLDYSMLEKAQVIILNNLSSIPSGLANNLKSFVEGGGSLAIFPALDIDVDSYNQLLSSLGAKNYSFLRETEQPISGINTEESLFRDVFKRIPENMAYPNAERYYGFGSGSVVPSEQVLSLKDGSPFFSKYQVGRGTLYLSAGALDKNSSELPFHAIFVPMMYKLAIFGARSDRIAYTLGAANAITVNDPGLSGDQTFKMRSEDMEFIPRQQSTTGGFRLFLPGPDQGGPTEAGIYELVQENTAFRHLVALNFDRSESEMDFFNAEDLKNSINPDRDELIDEVDPEALTEVVQELERGTSLWKLCLILALLFLGLETLFLRLNLSQKA